jgi:hypothetical protein
MADAWPFADPPNVAVLTTARILDRSEPILLVSHDEEDGMWQFLCGTTTATEDARIVGLGEILAFDDTLPEVADLPLGWRAWRGAVGAPWIREPSPPDGEE